MSVASGGEGEQDAAELLREALDRLREGPLAPHQAAARRLGQAVRMAIERLVASTAPTEMLEEAARRMEAFVERLGDFGQERSYEGVAESAGAGRHAAFFDWSPMLGMANPLAPPIDVSVEDGLVMGRVRFGSAYEGPPGCVHGGYLAAAFDEILGMAQSLSGQVGMTGTLQVRYIRPTPLHEELTLAGRIDSIEGRKVRTSGTVSAAGDVTASAEATFVTVSPDRFAELAANRSVGVRPAAER